MTDGSISLNVNTFDSIVLGVVALSALIAFFRGFLRELLSFGAWVGAAAITIYLFPHSDELLHQYVKNDKLAAGGGAILTFFFALLVISIINSIILSYVKPGVQVGLLDNFLGLVFGVLRGAFIVSFGFLILSAVIPKSPQPEWLKNSITKNYLKTGADMLVEIAPKYMVEMEAVIKKQVDHQKNPQDYPPVETEKDYKPGTTQELNSAIR